MAYQKQGFADGDILFAEHLEHLEQGIIDHEENVENPHKVTAQQVGARPDTWTPTAAEVGAATLQDVNAAKTEAVTAAQTYTNTQVRTAAPRNLLDNSDFRNPVMQAGFDGYHGNTRYPIDRWYDRYGFGKFEQTENGIGISFGDNHAYFCQKIRDADRLIGKPITLAICTTEGEIFCTSGIYITEGVSLLAFVGYSQKTFSVENGFVQICVPEGGIGLRWAALYEGEYTIDTLPEYQPKGYATELLECLRYYYRMNGSGVTTLGTTFVVTNDRVSLPIQMPVLQRNPTPSVTLSDVWLRRSDAWVAVGDVTAAKFSGQVLTIDAAAAGVVVDSGYEFYLSNSNAFVEISADL